MQVLNTMQKLVYDDKSEASVQGLPSMNIPIKRTFRTKFHLNVKCKNRNKAGISLLTLLVWNRRLLFNYRHNLTLLLRYVVETVLEWACQVLPTLPLKRKPTIGLRRYVWDLQAFLSTLFLLEIHLSARLEIWIIVLTMLSEMHLVKTYRLVQVSNLKPTCVKSDDIRMAVLTYYVDLLYRLV